MGNGVLNFAIFLVITTFICVIQTSWAKVTKSSDTTKSSGILVLPIPALKGTVSVEEAIKLRRSVRKYSSEPLTIQEVSQLLWAAQGITDPNTGFRAAPSAGATYPLEVYLIVGKNGVTGLEEGVYRYIPHGHKLEQTLKEDVRPKLVLAALGQDFIGKAPINIVITAVYERTTYRYGERGIRYVHMEVGHVGQNLHLQGVALGLGMVMVGAFFDDQVHSILNLPKNQKPLYIIPVGRLPERR